jgi:hypothetical protein
MPEPPVDSIVNVYETAFPQRSAVTMCVVDPLRAAVTAAVDVHAGPASPPATTGGVAAVGVISARRVAAYESESSVSSGIEQ